MKYWKKSNGDCGTMDNNGFVPNSINITKDEYDVWVESQPVIEPIEEILEFEDINTGKIYKLKKRG